MPPPPYLDAFEFIVSPFSSISSFFWNYLFFLLFSLLAFLVCVLRAALMSLVSISISSHLFTYYLLDFCSVSQCLFLRVVFLLCFYFSFIFLYLIFFFSVDI